MDSDDDGVEEDSGRQSDSAEEEYQLNDNAANDIDQSEDDDPLNALGLKDSHHRGSVNSSRKNQATTNSRRP